MLKYLYILLFVLFIVSPLLGQSTSQQSTRQDKRIALVIGNGNYTEGILSNSENDARSMTGILRRLGFTVYPNENLNAGQMKKAIDDFGLKLKGNTVGLFYYAGHGIQAKGYNYLMPVGAMLETEEQVEYDCIRADRILSLMETSGTTINIIILDACRNNPFERSWTRSATGKGLAFMNAPRGTLIAYVTAPGNTASDGEAFSEGFRRLGLEKLIGTRTWGGEIWLSSGNRLVDNGIATAAETGVYSPDGEWLIEGWGVEPDIRVDNLPRESFLGKDSQLEAGVEHLLKLIKEQPVKIPAIPKYPIKAIDYKQVDN